MIAAVDPDTWADRIARWARRHPRVSHHLRRLDHAGVVLGLIAFLVSLTPSLLPRSWELQGLVSGLGVVSAYASGVILTWGGRRIGIPPLAPRTRRRIWYGIGVLAGVMIPVSLWLGAVWQNDVRRAVDMPDQGVPVYIGIFAVASGVFVLLIGLARLVEDIYRAIVRRLSRFVPAVAARLLATVLVAALLVGVLDGLVSRALVAGFDVAFASVNSHTDAGVVQPASPLRSGGPGSLVSWSSLGREGRTFVAGGPAVAAIEQLTGRPAISPIRVYAGTSSADSLSGEAALVLAELKRTGAFDRALLAVGVPTGTGWLDELLAAPLEYMYGGNTAVAAMQYSDLPSWVSYLIDPTRTQDDGRTLFDTVYDYWSTLPVAHRPRLIVFGLSLGALGAESVFSGVADITNRTSAALFLGTPNSTQLWQRITAGRSAASPERLPVVGDGQTVRFAASSADLHAADGTLLSPRVVFLQHASDPIVWWSPDLIWQKPDWLSESPGPDVVSSVRWFPFVTFWQLGGDMIIGNDVPPGHGHDYGADEITTAWAALLHPPGWTDAATSAVVAALSSINPTG